MGHRLTKIYTRTGDDGSTGLGDGSRAPKDHVRVEAYGTVDELNSAVGLVLTEASLPQNIRAPLTQIQHELFDLGGELCIPGRRAISEDQVTRLEVTLDSLNMNLPALKDFILPGGTRMAAVMHLARAVCRRAERRMVRLAHAEDVNPHAIHYVNRLSDLLFVMARYLNTSAGQPETLWQPSSKN
jgi:cob(I)alamin adenosyltransferase